MFKSTSIYSFWLELSEKDIYSCCVFLDLNNLSLRKWNANKPVCFYLKMVNEYMQQGIKMRIHVKKVL